MKSFLLAAALLGLSLAACGSKDSFTGTWEDLKSNPGLAITLDITRSGDSYRIAQAITTTAGSGKPFVSHEVLNGVEKGGALQIAGGLVTLMIDSKTGLLLGSGMPNETEFNKVS